MGLTTRRPVIAAVTNRHLLRDRDDEACARLVEWAAAVAEADIDLLQVRERGLDDAILARLVRDILAATAGSRLRVLVNDRTDVALATRAGGVHLPSSAPSAATVRRIVTGDFLIGRSVHVTDDLAAIERAGGCDYMVFGTVYPSVGKAEGHPIAGVDALQRACTATSLPVLAIGGMTPTMAGDAARAGASGVAAISLFVDPWLQETGAAERTRRLVEAVAVLRTVFEAGRKPDALRF
jgi:thiamine-phosphate pyrophosphorylase